MAAAGGESGAALRGAGPVDRTESAARAAAPPAGASLPAGLGEPLPLRYAGQARRETTRINRNAPSCEE